MPIDKAKNLISAIRLLLHLLDNQEIEALNPEPETKVQNTESQGQARRVGNPIYAFHVQLHRVVYKRTCAMTVQRLSLVCPTTCQSV